MRVALDGTPLTVPTGGIRRYTEELFRALRSCFPEDEFCCDSISFRPYRPGSFRSGGGLSACRAKCAGTARRYFMARISQSRTCRSDRP